MAICKMSRLRLIGLKSDKNKIMNELIKSGSFEAIHGAPSRDAAVSRSHLDKAVGKQAKVSFAIEYLTACINEYKILKEKNDAAVKKGTAQPIRQAAIDSPRKQIGRAIIGFDDFYDVAAKEYELISVCDELEKLNFARLENKSETAKLRQKIRALQPYEKFPLPLGVLSDGANVSVTLWSHSADITPEFGELGVYYENYGTERGTLICVICRIADKDKLAALMGGAGFTQCQLRGDVTAARSLADYRESEKRLREKDGNDMYAVLEYAKYLSDLKVLYDVIGQDIEKSVAELNFVSTSGTFVAEGWVPRDYADKLIERVKSKTEKIVAYTEDPRDGDDVPTLLVSKKIMKPYEDVTDMYSVPSYREIDPNPFMAVFFFIFFGIMIGDAGYGLILSLAALLILKFVKLEKGTARLLALVGMGGVSAIIWGVLFGGIFSIEGIPALWFNPINEPLMMLGVSIILGAVQLLTGYALSSARKFRDGKPLDAILDSIFIFILFIALAFMALDMLLDVSAPLMTVGLILLGVALLGILCTAGRHNKGILSKIMGGFSGLYGLVNLLSDLLSYARLFGLGLASGAIGLAFNTLGSMFFGIPVAGYVLGIIILIPLHAFNIGIGVLGAYVHNARLQFLEFYGKFYDGGGRKFTPLGEKTKYVRFS